MQVADAFKAKFGKDLSPYQHQQLLELSHQHGSARVTQAIARMRGKVIDPVRAVIHSIEKLTRRHCHQCSYTWDTAVLGISICPRCRCGIVGSDGQVDRAKYEAYMHRGSVIVGQKNAESLLTETQNDNNATNAQISNATDRGQLVESQREKHSP